jgi:hypothetical protein
VDERDGGAQIAKHELSFHADDTIAKATEFMIAAGICGPATGVVAAIYLNDEPDARSEEVNDEAPTEQHLGTELHPGVGAP